MKARSIESFHDIEVIVYYQIISYFEIIKVVTIYSSIKNTKYIFEGEYIPMFWETISTNVMK